MTSSPSPAPRTPRRDDPRMHTVEMAAVHLEDVIDSETLGSGPVRAPLTWWQTALLVAAGGALGGMLRFALSALAPTVTTPTLVEVPWATFWVNLLGCLALGGLNGALEVRSGRSWMQPLLGTGLCGGFTTFSAVVLEGSAMIGADFPLLALAYGAATVLLCLGGLIVGLILGRRFAAPREASLRDVESRDAAARDAGPRDVAPRDADAEGRA
ncbi:MAG: fluoride efflux transporter FluC [Brachybacterium sp.]|uniref:fluoride efflux transporter FluC n=1 Tax=unclassified Brachybacterium TaxID=2623841 RepID=UPI003F8F14E5